jgi:hypothetical protein
MPCSNSWVGNEHHDLRCKVRYFSDGAVTGGQEGDEMTCFDEVSLKPASASP